MKVYHTEYWKKLSSDGTSAASPVEATSSINENKLEYWTTVVEQFSGMLQGTRRGSSEPPINFWLIIRALFIGTENIRLKRRYTSIKISILIHPYIDTSCPSLLPNAKTKNINKI
jgi:hypothetical protein